MLSKLALADAQRIAIRITIPQKKSSSLVAKLLLGVVEEYDLALRLLQAQSAGEVTEMTADLQLYIRNSHLYLTACAKCYLAKDHHQHDRNGLAVGFAQLAARDLETLAKNPKSAYAQEARRVLTEIHADRALYDKLNSTVTFAPVPKAEELVRQIPGGRSLLKMEVFTPSVLQQRTAGDAHSAAAATAEKTYALQHEYY
ncbi:hypothetical protein IWQ60_002699 [Tieghemiomyces parasiticus]|uniref:pH-response regulator protein palC n=1 Tax=Tieghemiomyces parasiticus TaxID=78921 RepID=A0A9W8AJ39_9FUNG|nr:hypothetical protein IWQ60_002699 [Tieghemiomyces parasiticus]